MQGDNLTLLKGLADNSVDSVVTDAPYGFGKEPDAVKLLQDWIDHGYHEIKGKGFMGNNWDAFVPQPILWKEIFRVLKPGGYLLCFFGTRTYDWGTMAIRLAGFEIRDMITWHYASGFPKNLDVSKSIDKMMGAERPIIGTKKTGADATKSADTMRISKRTHQNEAGETVFNVTGPATEEAKKYDGWGSALKPATEPICVARKPLIKNIANTILQHGTGAINIDACRIPFASDEDRNGAIFGRGTDILGANYVGAKHSNGMENIEPNDQGRFPANVIFDDYMGAVLDEQTGVLTSGKPSGVRSGNNNSVYNPYSGGDEVTGYGDTGGASRFFYCAKASQSERNAGCEHLVKTSGGFKNSSGRGISEREPGKDIQVYNNHPTVKPISLMRWLQRLVTPVGGVTLDPFAGSGTSGCAAAFEGFDCILMELDEDGTYIPIIEARTAYWSKVANRERYIQSLKDSQTSLF